MSLLQSILLGILQGMTEFLPVSSSGHLLLVEHLFGLKDVPLAYDIFLHAASLLAIIIYFRKIIATLISALFRKEMSDERQLIISVILGTLVTGLLMIPLKPLIEGMRHSIILLSLTFSTTAIILFFAQKRLRSGARKERIGWKDALIIGAMQALALFPGISRSGSTLAAGLFRGVNGIKAMEFSFLLAIPAIVGATILEAKDMSALTIPITTLGAGMIASFIFSLLSLKLLDLLIKKMKLLVFSIYLILLAAAIPFMI